MRRAIDMALIPKEHHKLKSFDDEIELLNRQWGTTWMQD